MAVGSAFISEPVIVNVAGGTDWRAYMSDPLLVAVSAVVFVVAYFGFPVWAIWLERALLKAERSEAVQQQSGLVSPSQG